MKNESLSTDAMHYYYRYQFCFLGKYVYDFHKSLKGVKGMLDEEDKKSSKYHYEVGQCVYYHPVIGDSRRYKGVVTRRFALPREGPYLPVYNLAMDCNDGYTRSRAIAACEDALTPRKKR